MIETDGRAGHVGTQCAACAARDVRDGSDDTWRKWRATRQGVFPTKFPTTKDRCSRSAMTQPHFVGTEWQLVEKFSVEAVALIEAGESTLGGEIEIVLRHHDRTAADTGGIVDG